MSAPIAFRRVGKAALKSAFTRVFDALRAACPPPISARASPSVVGTALEESCAIRTARQAPLPTLQPSPTR
jgi:hypothetical protein